jgi:hypothetical protein
MRCASDRATKKKGKKKVKKNKQNKTTLKYPLAIVGVFTSSSPVGGSPFAS